MRDISPPFGFVTRESVESVVSAIPIVDVVQRMLNIILQTGFDTTV